MNIEQFASKLDGLADEAIAALAGTTHKDEAIQTKNRYLGRSGEVQQLMQVLRELPPEQRREAGQRANAAKGRIEEAFAAEVARLDAAELARRIEAERIDVTLPARPLPALAPHPLRRTERDLVDIFSQLGFALAEGPEVEHDLYNFESLNFPPDHPARDMQDTFGLTDGRLLRTHTSSVQVRTMLAYEPPIAVISPGRVYRVDSDITHSPVFHQVEGLLIDEGVTFADLKGVLRAFVDRCFGANTPIRFRPSFFPFTEPSAEMDIGCVFCGQEGCRVCKHTGWLEILGCGMVDPNVFVSCGVDTERFTGFAFGMGVERIAMLRDGVGDIRLYFENDLRFLGQLSAPS